MELHRRSDVKRHQHPLTLSPANHWAHHARRKAHNLGLLRGDAKLKVLDEIGYDGLHLDETAKNASDMLSRLAWSNTHENFHMSLVYS